jgi:hypothetical protein
VGSEGPGSLYLRAIEVRVSIPSAPKLLGIEPSISSAEGVGISGNYAFVASGREGLSVVDLRNPSKPFRVTRVPTSAVAKRIEIRGNLALVANTPTYFYQSDGALDIFDISNPTAPRLLSRVEGEGNAIDVAMAGRYAYLANSARGLQILDIADPANPQEVGHLETEDRILNVAAEGSLVLIQEYPADSAGTSLVLVDVASPSNPLRRGSTTINVFSERFIVRDGRAYVAGTSDGLLIYDITNGTTPQLLGSSPSIAQADAVAVA